jgi:hypothetical protein
MNNLGPPDRKVSPAMSDVALIQGLLIGGPFDNAEVDAPDSFLPVIVAGDPDEYYFRKVPDVTSEDGRVVFFYQPRMYGNQ